MEQNTLAKTKYFSGAYEQEIDNPTGVVRHINYIYSPFGVVAAYIQGGSANGLYYLATDLLGSITAIVPPGNGAIEYRSYDAWGRVRNPDDWSYDNDPAFSVIDRGYTFHEHLPEFGLINMNGRVYDPVVGRFLSVDPYVQDPTNTQGFNRYSYCLNNPLKYTDPNGEVWWLVPVIAAAVFATGNTVAHAIRGDISNFWDGLKYFGQGAIVGFALGCAWQFAPLIPLWEQAYRL